MRKLPFSSPAILQEVRLSVESSFLASIVDDIATVESAGQEVKEYNFADETTFNHTWE